MIQPLYKKNIVVTRARHQASSFAKLLRGYGARVLVCPTIRIVPPDSFKPLDQAVLKLETYDWLIFTSVNGVEKFKERLRKIKKTDKIPVAIKTCAIGPLTADKMRGLGFPVTVVSKEFVAESILDALTDVRGKKILIPRASVAREILPVELKRRGADVDVVLAYKTVLDTKSILSFRRWLSKGRIDCITFTSSSTVKNFFSALSPKESQTIVSDPKIQAASIGPVTSKTLESYGWNSKITAGVPTTQSLAESIARFYRSRD